MQPNVRQPLLKQTVEQKVFFLSCFYIFYQWALLIFREWFSLNFSMATSFEVVNASWHTVLSMKIKYNTVSSHWLHLYVPICKIFFSTFRNISSSEAHFLYKIVIICCFTTLEVLLLINSLWGENKSSQMLRADKQPPPLYVMICLTLPQTLTKKGKNVFWISYVLWLSPWNLLLWFIIITEITQWSLSMYIQLYVLQLTQLQPGSFPVSAANCRLLCHHQLPSQEH